MTIFKKNHLKEIFVSNSGSFKYTYLIDPDTGAIFLDYEVDHSRKCIFDYRLKGVEGIYFFMETVTTLPVTGATINPQQPIKIGENKEEAIQFLIQKIIENPQKHVTAKVDIAELEKKLQESLKEFSE